METIKGFNKTKSYFEEGQFNYDQLDCTFGRKIFMNGTATIGWFQVPGGKLHGYGKDSKDNIGFYESGIFVKDPSTIE